MSRTHRSPSIAARTVRLRLRTLTLSKSRGANLASGPSGSQESVQNKASSPSPTCTMTEALNIASTHFSVRHGRRAQGAWTSERRSHSHLSLNANPRNLRSGSPRPATSRGEHTTGQATRQRPPDTLSEPAHTNARRRLSISEIAHGERAQVMETYTGIADRVVWARTVRPAKVRRSPFHPGILAAT